MSMFIRVFVLCSLAFTGGWLTACSGGSDSTSAPPAGALPGIPPVEVAPLKLESPVRLSADSNGDVWVADHLGDMIFLLDGDTMEILDGFSVGARPAGVVSCQDRILVAEQAAGKVSAYGRDGTLLYSFGQGEGEFQHPNGMALNIADKTVYVVDLKAAQIRAFTIDGADVGVTIGEGTLNAPVAVAYDSVSEEVLVSDFGVPDDAQVRIYAKDGTFLRALSGTTGSGMFGKTKIFTSPQGLASDGRGHLFLVDSLLGQVLVLDQITGALVGTLGQPGTGSGELYLPLDVLIRLDTGDLLVANNQLSRIELFPVGGIIP